MTATDSDTPGTRRKGGGIGGVFEVRRGAEKEEGIEVRSRGKITKGAPDCVGGHMRAHWAETPHGFGPR